MTSEMSSLLLFQHSSWRREVTKDRLIGYEIRIHRGNSLHSHSVAS